MRKLMKKLVASIILVSMTIGMGQTALANQWVPAAGRIRYQNEDGSFKSNGWAYIDGEWYYFDEDGYSVRGWIYDNGKYYYTESYSIHDYTTIYTNSDRGVAGKGTLVPAIQLVTNDVREIRGKYYHFDDSGAWIEDYDEQNGYFIVDGKEYYQRDGRILTGWFTDGKQFWFAGADGVIDRSRSLSEKVYKTYVTFPELEKKEGKPSTQEMITIVMYLVDVPENVLNRYFEKDNSYIHISYDPNGDGTPRAADATYNYNTNVITLYDNYSILLTHEFGHYVDAALNNESNSARFHQVADKYLESFADTYDSYCKKSSAEYFAEIFNFIYFNGWQTVSVKEKFPELYDYMTGLVNSL